jgi:hypothetical protein
MFVTGGPELKEVVHEVVVATKSEELLAQMIEELRGIREDFDQDRAEQAMKQSAYSGVLRFAPQSRDEWYNFLNLILTTLILVLALMQKPEPPTIVIQDQEQEIVQQLEEINEHLEHLEQAEKRAQADKPSPSHKPKGHR